jgi:hypothetical protein
MALRIRKIKCGKKCKCGKGKYHSFYLYRTWREGKKMKEKYLGVCDESGNLTLHEHEGKVQGKKKTLDKDRGPRGMIH